MHQRKVYRVIAVQPDEQTHIKTLSSERKAQALVIALYQSNIERIASGQVHLLDRRYTIERDLS